MADDRPQQLGSRYNKDGNFREDIFTIPAAKDKVKMVSGDGIVSVEGTKTPGGPVSHTANLICRSANRPCRTATRGTDRGLPRDVQNAISPS